MQYHLGEHLWDVPAVEFNPSTVRVFSHHVLMLEYLTNELEYRRTQPSLRAHYILCSTFTAFVLLENLRPFVSL